MIAFIKHMFNHFFVDSKIVVKQWEGEFETNVIDREYIIKHYYILTEYKNGNRDFSATGDYAKEHHFYIYLENWKKTGALPIYSSTLIDHSPTNEANK